MLAQAQPLRLGRESFSIDHLRTRFGQRTFADRSKFFIQLLGEHQPQHRIAEEFQALIVLNVFLQLVRDGGMGQSETQQIRIAKAITQTSLESVEIGHREND